MEEKELIEFAKWFVHSRRKKCMDANDQKASWFASDLMMELCHIEPFGGQHSLIKEYENYKKENKA